MIYLIVLVLTLFFIFLFDKKKSNVGDNAYAILLIVSICISGFRYQLGADSFGYERHFIWDIPHFNELLRGAYLSDLRMLFGPGWITLCSISKSLNDSIILFHFVHASVINGIIFWWFNKYSTYRFTCILLYFIYFYFYFNTEIQRESISICLFLLSFDMLYNKKYLKYFLISLLAFSFHNSAIILFAFPFIRFIKFRIVLFVLMPLLMVLVFNNLDVLVKLFLLNDLMEYKYNIYRNVDSNFNGKFLGYHIYFLLPYVILRFSKFNSKSFNGQGAEVYSSLIYFLFLASLFVANSSIGHRFLNYLKPIVFVIFVEGMFDLTKSRLYQLKFYLKSFAITLCLYFYVPPYFQNLDEIVKGSYYYNFWYPYTNIWQRDLYPGRENLLKNYNDKTREDHIDLIDVNDFDN